MTSAISVGEREGRTHTPNMKLKQWVAAVFAVTWIAGAATADAQCLGADQIEPLAPPPIPELGDASGPLRVSRGGRMVAPVLVNGAGPFRFIVDTGANRSAVSEELADRLGLTRIGVGDVHTVSGVISAPMTQIGAFQYGRLQLAATSTVPIVSAGVLAGEEGLLGVDGMQGRYLRIDFEHRCIEISDAARRPTRPRGWESIQGELRFGHLLVVQGRIRNQSVNVLIDTGSDSTLANPAFRDHVRGIRVSRDRTDYARAYTAGTPIVMESAVLIPEFTMGNVQVNSITAYVADFHIFRLWGFVEEPALLIGMDVLSQTRAIAIDYARGAVYFRLHPALRTGSRVGGGRSSSGMSIGVN